MGSNSRCGSVVILYKGETKSGQLLSIVRSGYTVILDRGCWSLFNGYLDSEPPCLGGFVREEFAEPTGCNEFRMPSKRTSYGFSPIRMRGEIGRLTFQPNQSRQLRDREWVGRQALDALP
jgi:hypothetical protein